EMFDKRLKIIEQGSLAQQQIPYLFGGHDLPYRRLFLVDGQCRGTQFVQLPVDLPRSGALSRSAADAHDDTGTDILALKAASEWLPTVNRTMTGQQPSAFVSLFLR